MDEIQPGAVTVASAVRVAAEQLLAAFALTALSPLLALVALAIKLDDGGPVFYSQLRIGKNLRPFRLWKFRSMVRGADRLGSLTGPSDPRTTRVGDLLRRSKLDELPQLFNVLRGEMQLVGPRPEVERYVSLFRAQYEVLLQGRPGITDPASLLYREEEKLFDGPSLEEQYVSQFLPDKLRISLEYQRQRSTWSDFVVLLRTVSPFFKPARKTAGSLNDVIPNKLSQ